MRQEGNEVEASRFLDLGSKRYRPDSTERRQLDVRAAPFELFNPYCETGELFNIYLQPNRHVVKISAPYALMWERRLFQFWRSLHVNPEKKLNRKAAQSNMNVHRRALQRFDEMLEEAKSNNTMRYVRRLHLPLATWEYFRTMEREVVTVERHQAEKQQRKQHLVDQLRAKHFQRARRRIALSRWLAWRTALQHHYQRKGQRAYDKVTRAISNDSQPLIRRRRSGPLIHRRPNGPLRTRYIPSGPLRTRIHRISSPIAAFRRTSVPARNPGEARIRPVSVNSTPLTRRRERLVEAWKQYKEVMAVRGRMLEKHLERRRRAEEMWERAWGPAGVGRGSDGGSE